MSVNERQILSVARSSMKRVASESFSGVGSLRCLMNRLYRRQHDSVRHTSWSAPRLIPCGPGQCLASRSGWAPTECHPCRRGPLEAFGEKEFSPPMLRRANRLRFVQFRRILANWPIEARSADGSAGLFHPCRGGIFTNRGTARKAQDGDSVRGRQSFPGYLELR